MVNVKVEPASVRKEECLSEDDEPAAHLFAHRSEYAIELAEFAHGDRLMLQAERLSSGL